MPCLALAAAILSALCVAIGAPLGGRTARADLPPEATWKQGPLKEEFKTVKWLPACGPAPASGTTGGGETVTVRVEGDELAIVGAGRVYRTNQCYDPMPTLSRESHSRDPSGHQWRTRCTTPPSDPRHAALNTLVVASGADSHIDLVETGRYETTQAEGNCITDVTRTRSYDLIASAPASTASGPPAATRVPAPQPQPPQPPAAPADARCATPGDPARLEVRPSRKLMRPGEAFVFRAIVVDAAGCATHTATTWALDAPHGGVAVDGSGQVTIPADAEETTFAVVATAAGKSAKVAVEVTSASRYEALLAQSGLNDAGESEGPSVAVIATSSIGGGDAKVEDGSRRRRLAFVAIVVSLALGLLAVGFIGSRRARKHSKLAREASSRHAERMREAEERRRERVAKHEAAVRAHQESVAKAAEIAASTGLVCPACRQEYPAGSIFCPEDASRLVPVGSQEAALGGASGSICPTCKRGFEPSVKVCPHDGEELVPYALYKNTVAAASGSTSASPPARGKICPTCGDRFEGNAAFCGKDGTALVLLN